MRSFNSSNYSNHMKKTIILLLLVIASLAVQSQTQNLLCVMYSKDELKTVLIPLTQWTPFPKTNDRTAWAKGDERMMKGFLEQAEGYLKYNWPSIPATTSLLIERTGDRNEYQG